MEESHLKKEQGKKIMISFMVDERAISLNDNFKVNIINDRDTLPCSSKGHYINLPALSKDSGYTVMFEFGNYKLFFDKLTKKLITPTQDIEWKFGIDNRPFNNLLGLLPYAEYKTNTTTKKLYYLKFNLLEEGDGIQFVKRVE